jgi:TFIIF-interacting CTD phosphatase-like protein
MTVPEDTDKKLILLDLDNTIICSEDLKVGDVRVEQNMEEARLKFRHARMEDYYDVFERPHLQDFLDYLFSNYRVGVWTASSKDYAIFVVKNFITNPDRKPLPDRKIRLFLCSHHCNVSKKYYKGVSKDLKLLSEKWGVEDHKNVILVDDLESLAQHQPANSILVKPFYYDSREDDTELLRVREALEALAGRPQNKK